jgi:hypothetical protein
MLRDFDIFEKFPDGSTIWRACVFGQFEATRKLQELAEHSQNEFIAIDIQAGEPLPVLAHPDKAPKSLRAAAVNAAKR